MLRIFERNQTVTDTTIHDEHRTPIDEFIHFQLNHHKKRNPKSKKKQRECLKLYEREKIEFNSISIQFKQLIRDKLNYSH